jgi:hypothetical protein
MGSSLLKRQTALISIVVCLLRTASECHGNPQGPPKHQKGDNVSSQKGTKSTAFPATQAQLDNPTPDALGCLFLALLCGCFLAHVLVFVKKEV